MLAGCGDDTGGGGGSTEPTGDETITLRLLANVTAVLTEDFYLDWAQPWLDQHPNVTLVIEPNSGSTVQEIFQQEIAAQDVPDIISGSLDSSTASQLVDLTQYSWATGDIPGTTYAKPDGAIYGIAPAVQIQSLVYYNKEMWAAAGITTLPSSLADFTDALRALKAYDPTVVPLLLSGEWTTQAEVNEMALPWVQATRDELAMLADGSLTVAESGYAPYFEAIETWVAEGLVSPEAAGITYDDSYTMFSTQEGATYIMGAWVAPTINELNNGFTAGVFETPTPDGVAGHLQYGNPAVGLFVPNSGANVDLALDLVQYLATDLTAVEKACVVEGNFARGVTYDATPLQEEINAIYGNAAGVTNIVNQLPGFLDQVGVPVQGMFGGTSAADALAELDNWLQQNRD
jgi:multiple sugar transport system substrate-binding protein/raffinose/stachyose/melibiose transport system substrate-binding protein